MNNVTR